MKKHDNFTVYFGGELFSAKHLIGNAYLAESIFDVSEGRYQCLLPQNLEQRRNTARSIRDQDIRTLFACDLALFNYDGPEIDMGTVVEFMLAKFADIPAVLLRSDFRSGGDQRGDPWNLMSSFYPRTANVLIDSLGAYKQSQAKRPRLERVSTLAGQHSSAAAQEVCDAIARRVVAAFDRVRAIEPVMPKHLREEVYAWLAQMPGLHGSRKELRRELEQVLERKVDKDLL